MFQQLVGIHHVLFIEQYSCVFAWFDIFECVRANKYALLEPIMAIFSDLRVISKLHIYVCGVVWK